LYLQTGSKTANRAAAYAVDLAKQLKASMIALSAGKISVLLKLEKQAKIIAA
jgi:hypothetical protein